MEARIFYCDKKYEEVKLHGTDTGLSVAFKREMLHEEMTKICCISSRWFYTSRKAALSILYRTMSDGF